MLLETPFRTQDLDAIAKAVTAGMATAKVAGPSVAIAKDGRLLFAAGFGKANPQTGELMDVRHRLRIGSISKAITSAAVMRGHSNSLCERPRSSSSADRLIPDLAAATSKRTTRTPLPFLGRFVILNLMVQYTTTVDRAFAALGDPTRRAMLERLGSGSASISELAEPFGMSLTGMKKHVRLLEEAELVTTEKVGRVRRCMLVPCAFEGISTWLQRLDRFAQVVERTKGDR